MQWLLTKRNRTAERTNRAPARQPEVIIQGASYMSHEGNQIELQQKTRQLLDGPLKHIKAAALAAALLPLASVVVTPASAQTSCAAYSGGVCGIVFNDANHDGIQEAGEPGLEGVTVTVCQTCDGTDTFRLETGRERVLLDVRVPDNDTTVTITDAAATGYQASPLNAGVVTRSASATSGTLQNGGGFSVATATVAERHRRPTSDSSRTPRAIPGPARSDTGRTIRRRGRVAASRSAAAPTRRPQAICVARQRRQGQDDDDVRAARRGEAEREARQRRQLR